MSALVAPSWACLPPLARAFARAHSDERVPRGRVVLFGDSDIARWSDEATLGGGRGVVRVGVDGARMQDVAAFAPLLVPKYAPLAVVVCAGENDICSGAEPSSVLDGLRTTVGAFEAAAGVPVPVAYIGTKLEPSTIALRAAYAETNRLCSSWTEGVDHVAYIDTSLCFLDRKGRPDPSFFARDGLHLSRKGYSVWDELTRACLTQLLPPEMSDGL